MKTGGKIVISLIVLGGAYFIFKRFVYDRNTCNLERTLEYDKGVLVGQNKKCVPMGLFQFKETK